MGKYRVVASIVCEGLLLDSTPDEEAPWIFKKRLQALLRKSFDEDVTVSIMKCERLKEE